LRDYDFYKHEVIVFDEAHASMIITLKKLFQAPADWVIMACSNTNVHSYKVWVHQVKMIVSTNTWDEDLASLPEVDSSWLKGNSVVLRVQDEMFVRPSESSSSSGLSRPQSSSV